MTSAYSGGRADASPDVAAGRLWAGGFAVAVVAALLATAGVVIARGVFHVPVFAPQLDGTWGDADTGKYALGAAVAALLATGIMHLLILFAPGPTLFFAWIMVLATAVAVLVPFSLDVGSAAIATALINLVLGIAIGSLTAGVAASATRTLPAAGPPTAGPPAAGPFAADPRQQPPSSPDSGYW
jgi:hypothetical protein